MTTMDYENTNTRRYKKRIIIKVPLEDDTESDTTDEDVTNQPQTNNMQDNNTQTMGGIIPDQNLIDLYKELDLMKARIKSNTREMKKYEKALRSATNTAVYNFNMVIITALVVFTIMLGISGSIAIGELI